jgi:hypothetical protein
MQRAGQRLVAGPTHMPVVRADARMSYAQLRTSPSRRAPCGAPPATGTRRVLHDDHTYRSTVTTCAWILPSTGPTPNRRSIAVATIVVASSRRPGPRASISARSGVPWQ